MDATPSAPRQRPRRRPRKRAARRWADPRPPRARPQTSHARARSQGVSTDDIPKGDCTWRQCPPPQDARHRARTCQPTATATCEDAHALAHCPVALRARGCLVGVSSLTAGARPRSRVNRGAGPHAPQGQRAAAKPAEEVSLGGTHRMAGRRPHPQRRRCAARARTTDTRCHPAATPARRRHARRDRARGSQTTFFIHWLGCHAQQ